VAFENEDIVKHQSFSASEGDRLSAREYLERYEPGVLPLIDGDIDAALREDTQRAHEIALKTKVPVSYDGRFPEAIWLCVYR
jgi:hypothetical protein